MLIRRFVAGLAWCASLALSGLVQANTVSATADPPPNQTLNITTIADTTSTQARSYPRGSVARLQASPSPGYQFLGWANACSGTASTCSVNMLIDRNVTARFGPVLSVSVSGTGTVSGTGINCGSDCSEAYAYGTSVTLTATPGAGQVFNGWAGACSGTASTCTVGMNGGRQASASFAPVVVSQFALTVSVSGTGSVSSLPAGISCGSDCSESYAANTSVSLTATPAAGQQFSGWGGACSGTGGCTVVMSQARSVSAAFAAMPTAGPVLHFADCQAGAQPGCVPGDNANAGTSPQAPKRTLAGIDVNALPAGTQLLFARGGAWNDVGMILRNMNATPERPLVFASYPSAWGGSTRPWLRVSSLTSIFVFGWYNETENDGGYTIRGLKLDGVGVQQGAGIFVGNNVHHVLLEDLEITGFSIGVQAQQNGAHPTTYTLRNSHIHHNSAMGLLGDGTDVVIEHNLFEANNFSGSAFNHAIYLGGHGRNGIVRHNRFLRNSVVNGRCTGGNVTVHGQWDGLLVEHNSIEQDASDMGCYGFSINPGYDTAEYFRGLVLRNNRIVNLGGCAICLTSVPGAVVENNLVVNTHPNYNVGIVIPDRDYGAGDAADGNAIIRNNTIVLHRAAAWNEAIALRANAGTGHQVVSNLIYFGTGSDPNHRCFTHGARSQYQAFDNNLCFHAAGTGRWSEAYANLGAANAAGFDLLGLAVDPRFVSLPSLGNDWDELIQATSPARGAGHPTLSSTVDRLGVPRSVPSMGSREPASGQARGVPRR